MKYLLLLLLFSCYKPHYNQIAVGGEQQKKESIVEDSTTMFIICFSGGGSRAIAMGYYIMDELSKVEYSKHTLFDEVDVVSGVSGGAFVAAAIPIYKDRWNEFEDVVKMNIERSLMIRLVMPWNILRMMSPYYSRTDMASEFYSKYIFDDNTFGTISKHPLVLINATLLSQGVHFVYDNNFFNYLGSDITSYPIGFAVAASSAFPGGFPAMTMRNYTIGDSLMRYPMYRSAFRNKSRSVDKFNYYRLRNFLNSSEWLHNQDGGLAGNTGVKRVLDAWNTSGFINTALNNRKLKKLIIMVVDAGTLDSKIPDQSPPSSLESILYSTYTAMNALSGERWSEVKLKVKKLWKIDTKLLEYKPYLIEINARNLSDPTEFNKIRTSFNISNKEAACVKKSVVELINKNKEYRRLIDDIGRK